MTNLHYNFTSAAYKSATEIKAKNSKYRQQDKEYDLS